MVSTSRPSRPWPPPSRRRSKPLDLLHRLVDASLVVADATSARYRLLFTVRAFLTDELRREGELTAAEERFLDRCLALAAGSWASSCTGRDEPAADRLLRDELDNLRAARDVSLTHGRDDVRVGITIALDEAAAWRDLRELWAWALELAADPPSGRSRRPGRDPRMCCRGRSPDR